jgi:hypothetical protein
MTSASVNCLTGPSDVPWLEIVRKIKVHVIHDGCQILNSLEVSRIDVARPTQPFCPATEIRLIINVLLTFGRINVPRLFHEM